MDIEGYEAEIFRDFPDILDYSPLLIHVELHPPTYVC